MWSGVRPIQLGREVIDPAFIHPSERVGEQFVVLVYASFDVWWRALGVDTERADAKFYLWSHAVDCVIEFPNECVDVVATPVGFGKRAARFFVGSVSFIIREFWKAGFRGRIRVEIVIKMDAGDVITRDEIPHDIVDVAADFRSTGIQPKHISNFVSVLWETAGDVIRGTGVRGICSGPVGVEPSMNGQPPGLCLRNKKTERVITGGTPLDSGQISAPWLEARLVEGIAFRPDLEENRVQAGGLGGIE